MTTTKEAQQDFLRLERRAKVCQFYVSGMVLSSIADKLGISTKTVGEDLRHVKNQWRESSVRDFDAVRNEQLAKLDAVETEAWDAWRRSQEEVEQTKRSRRSQLKPAAKKDDDAQSETVNNVVEKVSKKPTGESVYLRIVLDCVDRRMKLLGLEAPQWMIHEHVTREQAAERDTRDAEERSLATAIGESIRAAYLDAVAVSVGEAGRPSEKRSGSGEGLGEAGPLQADSGSPVGPGADSGATE